MFYPADPQTLRADVESYLAEAAGRRAQCRRR